MTKPNFLLMLASVALVGLGSMAYVIYQQDQVLKNLDKSTVMLSKQSNSDETIKIEDDLEDTDLTRLDSELTDIEAQLQ